MASSLEHGSLQANRSQIPDDERWIFADETDSSSNVERPLPSPPTAVNPVPVNAEVTYPEGGRIYNTTGVFQVVISEYILPEESSSTLGWIFSIYAFVNWIFGVEIGPIFDAIGPRGLLIAGTICTLIGIFALSVCTGKVSLPTTLHA
ncbi:4dd82a74-1cb3-4c82-a62c-aa18d34f90ad [Sclerotinia trifoliorum]|uniref:4dd82a74-1cb3-4c82-a62c-aa18d34f90ad n=1 Tax=Sclerotinia trifoliorum TaxID=28548 RepID=A0A8H2VNG5_9HELO|nr:4dd82a74-1cb3-4c82-a62c-aa18d34f90ad [Sclerotinia trifoliorum]